MLWQCSSYQTLCFEIQNSDYISTITLKMGRKEKPLYFCQRSGYFIQQLENSPMITVHSAEFKWLLVKSHFVIVKTSCSQMDVTQLICLALEDAH